MGRPLVTRAPGELFLRPGPVRAGRTAGFTAQAEAPSISRLPNHPGLCLRVHLAAEGEDLGSHLRLGSRGPSCWWRGSSEGAGGEMGLMKSSRLRHSPVSEEGAEDDPSAVTTP